MEIKKSKKADIDNYRATWFLLGVVFALSLLFVAFEYTATDGGSPDDEELLEDMSLDMDIYPTIEVRSFRTATARAEEKQSHDRLRIAGDEAQSNATKDESGEKADSAKYAGQPTLPAPAPTEETETEEDKPEMPALSFRVVEQIPEFPGGMGAFIQWLSVNLRYPEQARDRKIQGKVVVSFIVNEDGSISDAKVMKSVNPLLDREAMRVIGMMPKWKPGVDKDKPCRTMFAIPIVFKI